MRFAVIVLVIALLAGAGMWWWRASQGSDTGSADGNKIAAASGDSHRGSHASDSPQSSPLIPSIDTTAAYDAELAAAEPEALPVLGDEAPANDIPTIANDAYQEHVQLAAQIAVEVPFEPSFPHSPVVADAPRVNAFSLHRQRGRDASLPEIVVVGTGEYRGAAACPVAAPLQVHAAPGVSVTFHSPLLGSFSNGTDTITVTADELGVAQVAFRCGRDAGRYVIHAVSPSCRGMATMEVEADVDLAATRRLAGATSP